MTDPQLNPEYQSPAKAALSAARANMKAGSAAAADGLLDQAVASVIDAGEETTKAILYQLAYWDIVTFDPQRAGERLYLFPERRLREHDPKQVSLVAIAGALLFLLFLVLWVLLAAIGKELTGKESVGMLESGAPGLLAVVRLSPRFEEFRQSRYSGDPTRGSRGPSVTAEELDNLVEGVGDLIDFAANQQDGFHWKPEDLAEAQKQMPSTVKEFRPVIIKLRAMATRKWQDRDESNEPPSPSA